MLVSLTRQQEASEVEPNENEEGAQPWAAGQRRDSNRRVLGFPKGATASEEAMAASFPNWREANPTARSRS